LIGLVLFKSWLAHPDWNRNHLVAAYFAVVHETIAQFMPTRTICDHLPDRRSFTNTAIDELMIPAKERKSINNILDKLGINTCSLFPDLDGIARHIYWLRTHEY
jgi:hypothetical protein